MNPKPICIRPMTSADVDAVISLAAALHNAPHWAVAAYIAAVNPDATPRRLALVAEDAAIPELAGFIVVSLMPPEGELESIAVAPSFQRQSVARQLIDETASVLRNTQVNRLTLEVRSSNEAARCLYTSLGFVAIGRRPAYYSDPVDDAILMSLELA